jgi:hypothetical protein
VPLGLCKALSGSNKLDKRETETKKRERLCSTVVNERAIFTKIWTSAFKNHWDKTEIELDYFDNHKKNRKQLMIVDWHECRLRKKSNKEVMMLQTRIENKTVTDGF